jgi:hypothetical protein
LDLELDFCKNTSNEKKSNSKIKYANRSFMVCYQFFLLKINRLFFIRDAKFKMNKKKKNPSNSKFSTSFFSGETENKINFDINTEK